MTIDPLRYRETAPTQPVDHTLLLDKLGERLAFERTAAGLYQDIRAKLRREGEFAGGPTLTQIDEVILQKVGHFRLVADLIEGLGGDATAVTPSAELHAALLGGILDVALDPETSLIQCLEAALLAELAGREGWRTLLELITDAGCAHLLEQVKRTTDVESEHLGLVRTWLSKAREREPIARAVTLPEAAFSEIDPATLPG